MMSIQFGTAFKINVSDDSNINWQVAKSIEETYHKATTGKKPIVRQTGFTIAKNLDEAQAVSIPIGIDRDVFVLSNVQTDEHLKRFHELQLMKHALIDENKANLPVETLRKVLDTLGSADRAIVSGIKPNVIEIGTRKIYA